jgi:shikimate kinase
MGSGKTTVGRRVAAALGWRYVDSDEQLRRAVGDTAAEYADAHGRAALHRAEADALVDALSAPAPAVIAAAASAVDDERCRTALRAAFVAWLRVDLDVLAKRAATGEHRPLGDEVEAELHVQEQRRAPWFAEVADVVIDNTAADPGAVADAIVRAATLPGAND